MSSSTAAMKKGSSAILIWAVCSLKLAPTASCMKACALKYAIVAGAGGTSNERYHNF